MNVLANRRENQKTRLVYNNGERQESRLDFQIQRKKEKTVI